MENTENLNRRGVNFGIGNEGEISLSFDPKGIRSFTIRGAETHVTVRESKEIGKELYALAASVMVPGRFEMFCIGNGRHVTDRELLAIGGYLIGQLAVI